MPDPRLTVKQHLSLRELVRRRLACESAQEKGRWLVIELMSSSTPSQRTASVVARKSGYTPQRVRQLVHAYNEHGPDALKRKKPSKPRRKAGGRPRKLNTDELSILKVWLKDERSPYGEAWSPSVVVRWIQVWTGKTVHEATARRYLDELSSDWKERRRVLTKIDEQDQRRPEGKLEPAELQPGLFETLLEEMPDQRTENPRTVVPVVDKD